jgi:hypothetical protein
MLSRIPGSGTPPEDGNGTDRASKPRLLKAFSSNRPGHDEMLPTDYTSATGYAASGKRHHLWKPGGHATTAASTDSLVAQGPQRGCDSCRTVQNRWIGREFWYAASRGLMACVLSLHTRAVLRREGSRCFATFSFAVYVPCLQLETVEGFLAISQL